MSCEVFTGMSEPERYYHGDVFSQMDLCTIRGQLSLLEMNVKHGIAIDEMDIVVQGIVGVCVNTVREYCPWRWLDSWLSVHF